MRWLFFVLCLLPGLSEACSIVTASQYRKELTDAAKAVFGPLAPVAALASQIQTESCWRVNAISHANAKGLAQFIDGTGRGIARTYPHLSPPDPFNPRWAFAAQATLLMENIRRYQKDRTPCSQWLFAWVSYNGAPATLDKEVSLCRQDSVCDPLRFFYHVELKRARDQVYWDENRAYPLRILERQVTYFDWGPGVCRP